jgi:hypothetical protein
MRRPGRNRHPYAAAAPVSAAVDPHPPSVPLPEQGSGIEPVTIPSGILFVPGASASIDSQPGRDSRPVEPEIPGTRN